jgi:hypothetical protein
MRYHFTYNSKESRYCGQEVYYVYDIKEKDYVYDIKYDIASISIDRDARAIYFNGMDIEGHWILFKYYQGIIDEFLSLAYVFDVVGFRVAEECTGGQIYYQKLKYPKEIEK